MHRCWKRRGCSGAEQEEEEEEAEEESSEILLPSRTRSSHMKIWTSSSCTLPASCCSASRLRSKRLGFCCLVRQWIHVPALVLEAFWKNSTQFLRARAVSRGGLAIMPIVDCSASASPAEHRNMEYFWELTTGLFPFWFDSACSCVAWNFFDFPRVYGLRVPAPCWVLFTPGSLDDFL